MSEYYTWEFGPSFDRNRTDVLPVAYIAVPKLNSERGVTKIAADRLFPGNYLHQERIDLSSIVSPTVSLERILLQVQSSGAVFGGERVGNFQNTLRFEKYGTSGLEKTDPFAVDIINHPIKISGIEEDATGRWRVLTTPGSLCRKTSFRSTEPADSWLRKTNLAEGQALYLLYGIPEYWYGPTYGNFNSLTWGSSDFSAVLKTEVLNPTTSHSFNLHFTPVIGIEAVWVNGTFWASGFWDGSQDNSIFLSIDQDEGTINFKRSFAPTDELTVQYYTPRIDYSYGGFYHPLSGYFHLDLNPEEGHYTRDPGNGYYYPTRDILANGIQLYLTPCAAFTLSGDLVLGETSYTPIQLQTLSGSGLRSFRFNSILHDEFYQSGLPLHGGNTTGYWAHLEAPTSGSVITQIYQNYTLPTEHFDRIIGYLQVKYSGNYRFKLMHDDGVRMWIREPNDLPPQGDDPTSIDSWWHSDWVGQGIYPNTPAAAFADTNTVAHIFTKAMVSGTLYPIRLEWYNHTNESELSFLAALGSSSSFSIFSSGSFHDPLARDDQFLFNTITNTYIATGDLQYYSAFDYGETHFLRYRLGGHNDESIYDETAPANDTFSQETWGYGICGRAHYRDYSTNEASWNSFYPSSIALGRLMAAPPLNVETVRIADARVRGGGISEPLYDFYSQVGSGLVDRVSGFWDMSLWEGPTVKEGGSVSVTLPGDLLTTYTESEVRELVMKRIPPGIELLLSFTPATSAVVVVPEPDHTPHAPTLLVATVISSSQVDLSWTDNSTDENGFMIYRAQLEGPDIGPFRFLADTEAGVTSYQDTGLTKETRYYYRILAFNSYGYSDYTNIVDGTTPGIVPIAPTTLVATAISASQIDLTWVDNSDNELYFEVTRAVGTPDVFTLFGMINFDEESLSDTDCEAETTYYYKIRALGSSGNSDYANVASATTMA